MKKNFFGIRVRTKISCKKGYAAFQNRANKDCVKTELNVMISIKCIFSLVFLSKNLSALNSNRNMLLT